MKAILLAMMALLFAVNANAANLATAPLYGGPTQTRAYCYFYNVGSTPVSITGKSIITEAGGVIGLLSSTCGASIAPGRVCVMVGVILLTNRGHACRFSYSPDSSDVRGTLDIRNGSTTVLSNTVLQ